MGFSIGDIYTADVDDICATNADAADVYGLSHDVSSPSAIQA
jgi:hypothetical protein